jgi:hypothetical protein
MLADFGEVTCVMLLANLTTYSGNTKWWKKVDTYHDGDNTCCVCVMPWLFYCKADV